MTNYFDREEPAGYPSGRQCAPFEMRVRKHRATKLAEAIRDTHPDDARLILTAALIDLSAGLPRCAAIWGSIREEAVWWAAMATPAELFEVTGAALSELRSKALHRDMRKRLMWMMWQSRSDGDRRRFVDKVAGGAS